MQAFELHIITACAILMTAHGLAPRLARDLVNRWQRWQNHRRSEHA